MANTAIKLDALTRRFHDVVAVDKVSLEIREGEFFALLGPSGCGKTTLLRMIAGFETPDHGSVYLDNQNITDLRPNKRPVNMMFQSYALFPHMSVFANIAYGLEMEKLPRSEVNARTEEILEKTRLSEFARRKPAELSGGQRQRVALARAIVKQPRVLLLDEPLGALDKKLREQMQIELKRLQHELGITFVVVTHDQDEALIMADRIALMKDGSIVQASTPQELYDRPVNRFAADFIGKSNFIPGVVTENGMMTESHGELAVANPDNFPQGNAAVIAVRPERIRVSDDAKTIVDNDASPFNQVEGHVEEIAYRGQSIKLLVRVKDCEEPVEVQIYTGSDDTRDFEIGQHVYCCWRPEHGRLLHH